MKGDAPPSAGQFAARFNIDMDIPVFRGNLNSILLAFRSRLSHNKPVLFQATGKTYSSSRRSTDGSLLVQSSYRWPHLPGSGASKRLGLHTLADRETRVEEP